MPDHVRELQAVACVVRVLGNTGYVVDYDEAGYNSYVAALVVETPAIVVGLLVLGKAGAVVDAPNNGVILVKDHLGPL